MRSLGDDYVKAEFRRHQTTDNAVHIIGFLSQWKVYLDELNMTAGPDFRGKQLDPTVFERMSAEQIGQLYELMHASRNIWKSEEELRSAEPEPDDRTPPSSEGIH